MARLHGGTGVLARHSRIGLRIGRQRGRLNYVESPDAWRGQKHLGSPRGEPDGPHLRLLARDHYALAADFAAGGKPLVARGDQRRVCDVDSGAPVVVWAIADWRVSPRLVSARGVYPLLRRGLAAFFSGAIRLAGSLHSCNRIAFVFAPAHGLAWTARLVDADGNS